MRLCAKLLAYYYSLLVKTHTVVHAKTEEQSRIFKAALAD